MIVVPFVAWQGFNRSRGAAFTDQLWLWTHASNLALALGFGATFDGFDQSWTLAIEKQFYSSGRSW